MGRNFHPREADLLARPRPPERHGRRGASAKQCLCGYHAYLREVHTAEPLDVGVAMGLWSVAAVSRAALLDHHGRLSDVKRVELGVCGGSPLSICVGREFTFELPGWAAGVLGRAKVTSHAFGCLCVFPDSTHAAGGGHYWSAWCPACAPSRGQRRRAERRRIEKLWLSRALELRKTSSTVST